MGRYLVCYYSPDGTTKAAADGIASAIRADRLEIKAKEPYSEDYPEQRRFFSLFGKKHRRKTLPEIAYHGFNLAQYRIVFLGFPIRHETVPDIILSFLKTNDWSGQRIILFGTSDGDDIRQAQEDIRAFLGRRGNIPAASILDPSSPEKAGTWAEDLLKLFTKQIRTDAEEYVRKNYTEPVPAVKEEAASQHSSRAVTDVKHGTMPTPRDGQIDKDPGGRQSGGDHKAKYSRDLEPKNDLLEENRRLRKENEILRRRQELFQEAVPRRSALDRYNPEPIKKVLYNASMPAARSSALRTLDSYTDQSFVGKLLALIREKGMKEPDVYRAAQIDRKLFSKITSDQEYKPAKDTCVALAYALKLTLAEANDLLSRAGYTFSHSNKRDVILEFFFSVGKYDLFDINEVLSQLNQRPLGRQL